MANDDLLPTASDAVIVSWWDPAVVVSSRPAGPSHDAVPEPLSSQEYTAETVAPSGKTAPSAGAEIVIDGARRSTRFPPIGPAVEQLPAVSQTLRASVAASAVSEPGATEVESVNPPSVGSASPEPASDAVQAIVTLSGCHAPSGAEHEMVGG